MSIEFTDLSLICRLCTFEFSECYLIEGELENLIYTLTSIKYNHVEEKERENLRICTDCYKCLENFNEFKNLCIANQLTLMKIENDVKAEAIDDIQYVDEEDVDEEIIEFLSPIEDEEQEEMEIIKDDAATNSILRNQEIYIAVEKIMESTGSELEEPKESKNITTRNLESTSGDKGREIYQKLLQHCNICSKMIEKNRMEGHMNKHNNVRPYSCSECKKSFACRQLLRLHRTSIHTNIKVKCETCDKFFPSSRALYAHNLRHKNQDRYVCDLCDKKFNNSNSLKRHLAIHSGVREFICTVCGVGFYRKFNLDVHIKNVHHHTKEYFCDFEGCKSKFGYARLLKDHIKKHHITEKIDSVEY